MNLSILQRNTLDGLSDEAGGLYMRGCSSDEPRAFRCACEWDDDLGSVLEPVVTAAVTVLVVQQPRFGAEAERMKREVVEFIRERHFRRYFADGRVVPPPTDGALRKVISLFAEAAGRHGHRPRPPHQPRDDIAEALFAAFQSSGG